jgi:hypothetical protein
VCAAKRSAQHEPPVAAHGTATASSHARAGIVHVRGRPGPSPRRRAPSTSWERKSPHFLFWNTCRGVHTRVQPQRRAGAARAGACDEFNGQARGRGGARVGVDREGFGAGSRKAKRPDLGVLPDHRLQGQRAHRGQKIMWRVAQVLRCPPSRSAKSARRIARFK